MKTLTRLVVCLILSGLFTAQVAHAADATKKMSLDDCKAVLEKLKTDGKITKYELADYGGGPVLNLPDSGLEDLSLLKGMPIAELNLSGCRKVTDLSPLKELPTVRKLVLFGMQLKDFSVVKDLKTLVTDGMPIEDLGPLAGMPIEQLWVSGIKASDINVLRDMPLKDVSIGSSPVSDISVLKGKQIWRLTISDTKVSDLTPLEGMPLRELTMGSTKVKDLSVLKGMPLQHLRLGTWHGGGPGEVGDLSPLLECKDLQTLTLPDSVKDISLLKKLSKLGSINEIGINEDFWKKCEAGEKPWEKKAH